MELNISGTVLWSQPDVQGRGNEKTGFLLGIAFWYLELSVAAESMKLFDVADVPMLTVANDFSYEVPHGKEMKKGKMVV